jgi:outer membrane protein assembly factor BamB
MFDQAPTSKPWYLSWPGAVLASGLLLLAGLGVYLLVRRNVDSNAEAHYAALERHRAEQQQQGQTGAPQAETPPTAAATNDPAAQATTQPDGGQPAEAQVVNPAEGGAQTAQPTAPAPASRSRKNYWTEFRGPRRDGRYDEQTIKTNWPASGLSLQWRQPIGGGYSSFSVADGVAYTIEQRRGQEVVVAYQLETGRELWTHGWDAVFRESTGDGPRSTPTWDAGRIYALGGTGELRALDAKSGKLFWSKNILKDNGASNLTWGMAASPLIVGDKVVLMPGGTSGKSVVAYNKMTGAPVWKALSDEASYTSPMLVRLAGREQILVVTARRAAGLNVADGTLLWEHPWANSSGINISQPIIAGTNRFFLSAGYGKGASLVEVSASGNGFAARTVWENGSMKNKFNSSVLHEGHVYGLDEGILTCVDMATGQRKWKGGRYGYGQVILVGGGNLIVTTEEGEIVLVRATPEQHTEVARFSALEGRTWNIPAIADGRLLVRNATQMACYKLTD